MNFKITPGGRGVEQVGPAHSKEVRAVSDAFASRVTAVKGEVSASLANVSTSALEEGVAEITKFGKGIKAKDAALIAGETVAKVGGELRKSLKKSVEHLPTDADARYTDISGLFGKRVR